jgi:hypothetical protein
VEGTDEEVTASINALARPVQKVEFTSCPTVICNCPMLLPAHAVHAAAGLKMLKTRVVDNIRQHAQGPEHMDILAALT